MFNVKFAENISIESLNPHNFAMKNEYIDNLISTAWLIIPKIATDVDGLRVVKGFLSDAYMRQNYRLEKLEHLTRHGSGLALELTWESFTVDDATSIGIKLLEETLEPLLVIVDTNRSKLCVYRRFLKDKSLLTQMIDNNQRLVKSIEI